MAIESFAPSDFREFDLPGFAEGMAAIRAPVRRKLEGPGSALAPDLAQVTGTEIHPHARHARRTVNPPDDTWVAFGPDCRGYKKAPHFKIAVSEELDPAGWARLGEELTRTRDGQLVPERRVEVALAARLSGPEDPRAARETFGTPRECFRLR